jgi:hypothetical protein
MFVATALVGAMSMSSCEPGDDTTNGGEELPLVLSTVGGKTSIMADGVDAIEFKVMQGDDDVTAISRVCATENGVCLTMDADYRYFFSTSTPGNHEYHAYLIKDEMNADHPVSNSVFIEAADPFAFDATKKFHKTVAFFSFTATWCGPCLLMKNGFDLFYQTPEYSDTAFTLNFHLSSSDPKVSSNICNGFFYNIIDDSRFDNPQGSIPYTIVGLNSEITGAKTNVAQNVPVITALYDAIMAAPAKTGVAMTSSIDGSAIGVNVAVAAKDAGTYQIGILLVEDGVKTNQVGFTGLYSHTGVLRDSKAANIFGEEFATMEAGQVETKEYSFDIDPKYNAENLSVVVYTLVQNAGGKWLIDNSVKVPVGQTQEFRYAE